MRLSSAVDGRRSVAWFAAVAAASQLAIAGVVAAPASAGAKPIVVSYRQAVSLQWRVLDHSGHPVRGKAVAVVVRAKRGATAWRSFATARTDVNGTIRVIARPETSSQYALQHTTTAGRPPVTASPVVVDVSSRVAAAVKPASLRLGAASTVSGSVLPAKPGAPVQLQRLKGRVWVQVATADVDAAGRFVFAVRPSSRGRTTYRVLRPADSANTAGVSAALVLSVT